MARLCLHFTYELAGMKHVKEDEVVGNEVLSEAQREINGHVAMMTKIFKIGKSWNHQDRVRETLMGESMSVCPVSLLYKDHKGWVPGGGSKPPTRPVAGGHLGINLHISEVVSDILDPVVELVEGGKEIISTEDMVAKVEMLNDKMKDWNPGKYWAGMVEEDMIACDECVGTDIGEYSRGTPELCECEVNDGIDEYEQ